MIVSRKSLPVKRFFHKHTVNVFRLIDVYRIRVLIFTTIAIGSLSLYIVEDNDLEQKLGDLANIVIAIAVCWMSFSSYNKSNIENRKNELEKSCTSIIEVIMSHGNRGSNGDILINRFGKDGAVINTFGGRRYLSQWFFMHHEVSGYCVFQVRVQRMSYDGTYTISDTSEAIMYRSGPSGWDVSTFRNTKPDQINSSDSDVAINAEKISSNDWEALMQAIAYIYQDMGPKIED